MNKEQLTVAAVQLSPGEDWQANLDRALSRVRLAAEAGATFIALPEYFAFYGPADSWRGFVEEHAPSVLASCKELAREKRITLLLGTALEPVPDSAKVWNTSILLGPEGEELARYQKIHLFDVETPTKTYRESQTLEMDHVRDLSRM